MYNITRLKKTKANDFHSTSRKWSKELKRLGVKRQRANSKALIKEFV